MNINYFNVLYFFFQDNKTLRLNETHLVEVNVVSTLKWVLFSCAYMYVEMIWRMQFWSLKSMIDV